MNDGRYMAPPESVGIVLGINSGVRWSSRKTAQTERPCQDHRGPPARRRRRTRTHLQGGGPRFETWSAHSKAFPGHRRGRSSRRRPRWRRLSAAILGCMPLIRFSDVIGRSVVLVEGISDQLALEALAERRGRNLDAEDISIVAMGGATNIGGFLDLFGPQGFDVRLAGLCDAAEEGDFQRGLERAGLGSNLTRADMERLGFYVCVADLEDELIRSLGAAVVEQVVDAQGELGSFRTFQKQPQWRARTAEEQLRRFFGTHRGRKIESAALLVDALDLDRVPRPLDLVLAHVKTGKRV